MGRQAFSGIKPVLNQKKSEYLYLPLLYVIFSLSQVFFCELILLKFSI